MKIYKLSHGMNSVAASTTLLSADYSVDTCEYLLMMWFVSGLSQVPASDTDDSWSRRTSLTHTPYHRLHYSSAPRVNVGNMSLPASPGLACFTQ